MIKNFHFLNMIKRFCTEPLLPACKHILQMDRIILWWYECEREEWFGKRSVFRFCRPAQYRSTWKGLIVVLYNSYTCCWTAHIVMCHELFWYWLVDNILYWTYNSIYITIIWTIVLPCLYWYLLIIHEYFVLSIFYMCTAYTEC